MADLEAVFATFDADGSGFITKKEIRAVLTQLFSDKTEEEIGEVVKNILEDADEDSDDKINKDELKVALENLGFSFS